MGHLPPRLASLPLRDEFGHGATSGVAQVVVVGAGLAGLVTARQLARRGISVIVLEAEPRLGGRVHTITFPDGVTAEAHLEEFWEGSPAYALLSELGLPLAKDTAHSSVVIDATLWPYTGDGDRDGYLSGMFDPTEREAFLTWNARAAAVLDKLDLAEGAFVGSPVAALQRSSFSSFVGSTGVPRRVSEWLRVVVESETAVEWDRIGALDGIAEMRPFLDTPAGFGERNAHVLGGNARFVAALVDELPLGCVRTGARVRAVVDDGRGVDVNYEDSAGHARVVRGGQAVLTVPVWALADIVLEPGLGAAAEAAIASTAAGRYVKVILRLRPEVEQVWARYGAGLFTLLSDSPVGCIYLADGPGTGQPSGADLVMTLLVHGRHAGALNGLPPDEIARRALAGLDRLRVRTTPTGAPAGLLSDVSRFVTDVRVFDYPRAVAYWPIAVRRSRFDALAAALRAPHGRVLVGGDTTDSSHSDGAVRAALRMSAVIEARLGSRELVHP